MLETDYIDPVVVPPPLQHYSKSHREYVDIDPKGIKYHNFTCISFGFCFSKSEDKTLNVNKKRISILFFCIFYQFQIYSKFIPEYRPSIHKAYIKTRI